MILNDICDRHVCICLKEREDKYEQAKINFDKHNIKVDFYRPIRYGFGRIVTNVIQRPFGWFNANQSGEFGCSISHYTVIKNAYLDGVERLMIWEDDIAFHKDFDSKISEYIKHLPNDWNIFFLYNFSAAFNPNNITVNDYWKVSYKCWSNVAYVLDRKAMGLWLNLMDSFLTIADVITYNLQETEKYGLNCYSAYPSLVNVNTYFKSDIREHHTNERFRTVFVKNHNDYDYSLSESTKKNT